MRIANKIKIVCAIRRCPLIVSVASIQRFRDIFVDALCKSTFYLFTLFIFSAKAAKFR